MKSPTRSAVFGSNPALVAEEPPAVIAVLEVEPIAHLERHPVAVYLAGLAPGSRRTMLAALRVIAKLANDNFDEVTFPRAQVTFGVAQAIRSKLGETYAPTTANRMLAALKGVLKVAFKLGLIDSEGYTRATSIEPVRGSRLPKGRPILQGELRALFGTCNPQAAVGARDAALLGLLYAGGLRRAEVVALDLEHLDIETGAILVKGKGNKERRIYVGSGALDAVKVWLGHRGSEPGPLLLPVLKGGKVEHRRLIDQAVAERLRYIAKKAGVSKFSPHDVRRTFVGDMLDAGADLVVVQQLAGHASPTTTAKYDRRGERAKQRAAGLLHVPFTG